MATKIDGHQRGPWRVAYDDHNGQAVVSSDIEVCTCWHHSVGAIEKEMRANAALIAAAPLLLEIAEAVRRAIDGPLTVAGPPDTVSAVEDYRELLTAPLREILARYDAAVAL